MESYAREVEESPWLKDITEAAKHGNLASVKALWLRRPENRDIVTSGLIEAQFRAIQGKHIAMIRWVLTLTRDTYHTNDGDKWRPSPMCFRTACDTLDPDVMTVLFDFGAPIDMENNQAIFVAANAQKWDIVKFLLERGADINALNGCALSAAIRGNNTAAIDMLLDAEAMEYTHRVEVCSHLGEAAIFGCDAATMRKLLSKANMDDPHALYCAVKYAFGYENMDAARELLAAGCPPKPPYPAYPGRSDRSILSLALGLGNIELVQLALDAGVIDYDRKSLEECARRGDSQTIEWAIRKFKLVSEEINSLLYVATSRDHNDTAELLLRHGADPIQRACRFKWTPSVAVYARPEFVSYMTDEFKKHWYAFNVRIKVRLRFQLLRARNALDRPPHGSLCVLHPTRAQMIAHLKTAGRRFARDYWTEGVPIFFPSLAETLGPLPDDFAPTKF